MVARRNLASSADPAWPREVGAPEAHAELWVQQVLQVLGGRRAGAQPGARNEVRHFSFRCLLRSGKPKFVSVLISLECEMIRMAVVFSVLVLLACVPQVYVSS